MDSTLILNAKIVNEGKVFEGDIILKDRLIEKIGGDFQSTAASRIIDARGKFLIPGVIDDQVHFREPGLTHKGTIYSESKAAVAGGVTSYMEMPNTVPPAFTQELLSDKYAIAEQQSLANFSFFMGASNSNYDEVMRTNLRRVCGLKIFMGSSTGNLLVDDPKIIEKFFAGFPGLIATHCEDEPTIRHNTESFRAQYGESCPVKFHPLIRSEEACYKSSSFAVGLAKKLGTRLHVLHISTAKETALFDASVPLRDKKITAEVCVHHLWFNEQDYEKLGTLIKWNPAIKKISDQVALFDALLEDRFDVVATDHAPHTLEEKGNSYFKAPSGGPLVQHSLVAMMEFYHHGKISIERLVEKMCHNPAIAFGIHKRGFIREGYFADLVLIDGNKSWTVSQENILAKCGWSPFEGTTFQSTVSHVWVSGHLALENGHWSESQKGLRLEFDRI
jgi:dihydroorotase